jgi:hypothetical protein
MNNLIGLTRIAGHLLLQAPDEDAFWIFVAVMDTHLRGYYHVSNMGQFEIDASIFQSLLESVEPELAHMLFVSHDPRYSSRTECVFFSTERLRHTRCRYLWIVVSGKLIVHLCKFLTTRQVFVSVCWGSSS